MSQKTLGTLQVVEKDEVPIRQADRGVPYGLEDEGTDIEVALPDDPGDVPADADADDTQFGRGFGQEMCIRDSSWPV